MTTSSARFDRLIAPQQAASTLRRRTVRSGAYAMAAEGIEFVLRLGSLVVLARLLVPEHFGLIAMVTAITSIAERFKDLGLSIATVQREEITHEQVSTLFWINTGLGAALVLLFAVLAWPVAHFYDDDRLFLVTLAISSSMFWGGISVQHQALLRRQMQYGRIATIQIGASVASIVVAVALAMAGFGYWALVAREVSRGVFIALGSWLSMPWIPGAPRRGSDVRSMLAFGGDVTAFNLIAFLTHNLDQIIIGKLFGATPLGLYRQGINLVLAPMTQLTYPVNSVAESALSRLQGDPDQYRRYYRRILGALSMVTMPLAVFLALFAEEIVRVALGTKWLAATEFFRILAVAAFIRPQMATIGAVMVSCGLSRRYLWWGLGGSAFLAASVLTGSLFGTAGVAYAQIVFAYLWIVPSVYWGLKETPIDPRAFAEALHRPIVASLVMGAVLFLLKRAFAPADGGALVLAWGAPAAALVYVLGWLFVPGGRAELAEVVRHVKSALGRPAGPVTT